MFGGMNNKLSMNKNCKSELKHVNKIDSGEAALDVQFVIDTHV